MLCLSCLYFIPPGSSSSSRFLQVAPPGSSRFLQVTPCLPGSSRFLFVPPGFSWFLQVSPGSFSDQVNPKDERFVFTAPRTGQHGEDTLICCVVLQSVEALKKTLMLFWITMIWAGGKSTCENKSQINSKPTFLPALIWAGGKSTRENKSDIFSKPTFFCNKTVLYRAQTPRYAKNDASRCSKPTSFSH